MKHQTYDNPQHRLMRTFPIQLAAIASTAGKNLWKLLLCLLGVAVLTGCASTKVTNRDRLVYDKLPRPEHIYIYDFASTPEEVPSDSAFAGQVSTPDTHPTEEQLALGRQLGTEITARLVDEVREMGLPAERGNQTTTPQINDIVIRGYLVSIEKGSAAKRMIIGFGSGGSELTTAVEGYQMTDQGLRKLGSATTGSKSGKGPGASLGAAGWLITGSPVGLIVGGGMKIYGEASGSSQIEGRAKKTAKELGELFKKRAEEEGWID